MEINWSTFFLEIINFLVLIWILHRFLYKPVLSIIRERQQKIERDLEEAQEQNRNVEQLRHQYEDRITAFERERQQARDALAAEINKERKQRLLRLESSLLEEEKKHRARETRRQEQSLKEAELRAMTLGARFATKLLQVAAGPELETRLLQLAINQLSNISDDSLNQLRSQRRDSPNEITVSSAYAIAAHERNQLAAVMESICASNVSLHYEIHADLIAGIRIDIGPVVMDLSIANELRGFMEFAHDER